MQVNGLKLLILLLENLWYKDVILGSASNFYIIFPQIPEPVLLQKWTVGTWVQGTSCIPSLKLDFLQVSALSHFFSQSDSIKNRNVEYNHFCYFVLK
jgi:hypothetical protein